MKATPETVAHLQLALDEITTREAEKVKAYRHQVTYVNDQFTAFVWGLYHALYKTDKEAIRHNQGNPLQDSHIETALKQVLKEYK